jgi:hypothetical protein
MVDYMRIMVIAVLGLSLFSQGVFAQTGPQTAAVQSASPPAATPPVVTSRTAPSTAAPAPGSGITREQYIQRAQDRAAQRAANRFDQLDSDHDGVLDRSERRAWRSQHARRPAAQTPQPAAQ